ncbi:MAG: sigma-70 family RNA polymerase sigma factor [Melioribacteraceae bacterium]
MTNIQQLNSETDIELISKVREGEQSAFTEIVKRYESKIAATIYGMLGNCDEADDVGQEVFIRFYNLIEQFEGNSNLGTYLTRIAINLSLNEIKRKKRREFISWDIVKHKDLESNQPKQNDIKFEEKELIQKAFQKIKTKFRVVLILRIVQGYSTEETSKILKLPLGTVLSRLARGQKKLKELLTPYMEAM